MKLNVREQLENLLAQPTSDMRRFCYSKPSEKVLGTFATHGWHHYQGKVRDVFSKGDKLMILHSDRLSAFDCYIADVPFKGIILNEMNEYWLSLAHKQLPTHFRGKPHARVLASQNTTPIKLEIVVRGYLAGSMLKAYKEGRRDFCGHRLPEGLIAYGELPAKIITPTTKEAAYVHDEEISIEQALEKGLCSPSQWRQMEQMAFQLFELGQQTYAKLGWLLIDTKYEFGMTANGEIIVIDEIHTPDCSRLWVAESYPQCLRDGIEPQMLDKQNVRAYLLSKNFNGYGDVPEVPRQELVKLALVYLTVLEKLLGHNLMVDDNELEIDAAFMNKID